MKFFHLADLHLGKRVHEWSMLEDQAAILAQILDLTDRERPDAVILAGDIYDKPVPSTEAVTLLDGFLADLSRRGCPVMLISGNHDSPERLSFGGRLMEASGIHVAPVFDGVPARVTLEDGDGPVHFWLLPFVKPAQVRRFFPEEEIGTYTDAVRAAVAAMTLDPRQRNVLVTHQFVTGSQRSESEELSVGGVDNVDASVFSAFDYVALGHLHRPQNCGPRIRYSGSPLKYSFSEERDEKSVTVAELDGRGALSLRTLPLRPLRELVTLRGTYEEVTRRAFYEDTTWREDYVRVILTDEEDVPDAAAKLRVIYPYLMRLDYDNARTRESLEIRGGEVAEARSPLELFEELFRLQNNAPLSREQTDLLRELLEGEGEVGAL